MEDRLQTHFIPYAIKKPIITEFERLVSKLQLLEVTDIYLVNQALCDLDQFFSTHEQQFLDLILPDILIRSLIRLLVSLKALFVSHKIILKLLAKLLSFKYFLPIFEPFITELDILFDLFTMTMDYIIQEQVSYIILKLMNDYDYVLKKLCCNDLLDKLYNLLENCTEMDVVFNCISIFETLCTSAVSHDFMFKNLKPAFLSNRVKDATYQEQIFNILEIFVNIESAEYFTLVFSAKLLKVLFGMLMQPVWSDTQNKVMQILYKCAGHDDPIFTEIFFNPLLAFTSFALESTSCHGLACVTLFAEYTNLRNACSLLIDKNWHHTLAEFFDINCEFIEIKMCKIIGNLCDSCDLSDDKFRDYFLSIFIEVIGRKRLSWQPYREAALQPIHAFLSRNKSVANVYFEKGLFPFLKTALRYGEKLSKKCFREVLEIYEMLVNVSTKYFELMLPQDIYEILMYLFKFCVDNNEGEHYICCCNIIFYSFGLKRFRNRFLRHAGFEIVCSALSNYKQNVLLHLLEFVYMTTNYEEFACALMQRDIINILLSLIEDVEDVTSKKIQIAKSILFNLKRYELMYKFSFFNTLGVNDHIGSFFMASAGSPPSNHNFKHENEFSKTKTVIVVNKTNATKNSKIKTTSGMDLPYEEGEDEQEILNPHISFQNALPPPPLKSALAKYPRSKKSSVILPDKASRLVSCQLPRFSLRLSSLSLLDGRGTRYNKPLETGKEMHASIDNISEEQIDVPLLTTEPSKQLSVDDGDTKKSQSKIHASSTMAKRSASSRPDTTKKSQINTGSRFSTIHDKSKGSTYSDNVSAFLVSNYDMPSDTVYEEDEIVSIVSEEEGPTNSTGFRYSLIEKIQHLEQDEPLQFFISECKNIVEEQGYRSELLKWQKIAQYVHELYTPIGGYTEKKYQAHINIIKGIFQTSYLSIGYIRVGSICERAIMFKLICDSMYLPCELKKHTEYDDVLWVEVPIYYKDFELKIHASCRRPEANEIDKLYDGQGPRLYQNCVMDLINNVGALYPIDSEAARKYHSPRLFEYESDDSESSIGF